MLNNINVSMLATPNQCCGVKINNDIINVITDIVKLKELDITILLILMFTFSLALIFFLVIKPSALKSFNSVFII